MKRTINLYRNAYSGLAPATWWLSLVMLVNRCGTMVVPFMSLYLTESRHVSIGKAGLVMALFGAGAICGGILGGKLSDKIGFYPIQLVTLIGGGCMFLLLGQITSYPLICVTTFLLSVVNESFRPANASAIAHYSSEENRTRSYSLNRLAINLGWALGGSLGGFIAAHNYQLLFWIDGCTNITAALLLWAFLAPSKNKASIRHKPTVKNEVIKPAYKDIPYMVFILLTVFFAYSFFQVFSTLPLFYKRELHLSEEFIGSTMALNGIMIVLFEMVVIFKLEGQRKNVYFITCGILLTACSFAVFNFISLPVLVALLSTVLITVGEILAMPFMNSFWIGRSKSENRGQYAGLYTVAWSVAQVLGPGTGAWIAERHGFHTLWWIVTVICLIGAVGYKLLGKLEEKYPA